MSDQNGKMDKDYCGLEPFTTGKIDPYWKGACKTHDEAFKKLIKGEDFNILQTTGRFIRDCTSVALKGAYQVATFPIYVTIGGVGGIFRWAYLKLKR